MFNNKYGNFIYRKRGALSQEGCGYAIKFLEKRLVGKNGTYPVDRRDDSVKKCVELFVKRNQYTFFEDVIQSAMREYGERYILPCFVAKFDISSILKIQKYNPGEAYYHIHCEHDGSGCAEEKRRMLVWMIYLNDVTEGGHTVFPAQNKKFQPRAGDLLMWPAFFTHPHHGIVSKTQTKYIATGWCCFEETHDEEM